MQKVGEYQFKEGLKKEKNEHIMKELFKPEVSEEVKIILSS
jgi:hypothetical protein